MSAVVADSADVRRQMEDHLLIAADVTSKARISEIAGQEFDLRPPLAER
jgi:hypothetical protein